MENSKKKLFENTTKNSEEAYAKFLQFHSRKFNINYLAYTIFWSLVFLLCAILAFDSGSRIQGVICTILLISFIGFRIAKPKLIVNKELNSGKVSEESINKYSFYDKTFEIKNKNGTFTYRYFMLKKIFETKDYFYLYVTKENAFLVSKNTFSLGNVIDFSQFMKSKCRSKYKSNKKQTIV